LSFASLMLMSRRPPIPSLFPYTTLFRSVELGDGQYFLRGGTEQDLVGGQDFGADDATDLERQTGAFAQFAHQPVADALEHEVVVDRKSTRLNSSHVKISYAVFCLKKKKE